MECWNCVHHATMPGSCHLQCRHPKCGQDLANPLSNIMAIFASVGRVQPRISMAAIELGIEINPTGIKGGWANWPWNFDPRWIETCNGYEERSTS